MVNRRKNSCRRIAKLARKRKPVMFLFDSIPENVVFMILKLFSLRDAARASALAQKWLHSWRFYPNLEFTTKTLGLNKRAHRTKGKSSFVRCVNSIIRNHAGTGVESFSVKRSLSNHKYAHFLDRWIYFAVSSGAKKNSLDLLPRYWRRRRIEYNFPSSNLAATEPTSIEHLQLCYCYLKPSPTFIGLSNLKTLDLNFVCITVQDLESLLSYTLALQQLKLRMCHSLDHLKIPDVLSKLIHIDIYNCWRLRTLEIHAQNIVSINVYGTDDLKIVPSGASLLKDARFEFSDVPDAVEYAFTELAPRMPNLETLFLIGPSEMFISGVRPCNRFHSLRHLKLKVENMAARSDLLYVVSFLDAAPLLEVLVLHL